MSDCCKKETNSGGAQGGSCCSTKSAPSCSSADGCCQAKPSAASCCAAADSRDQPKSTTSCCGGGEAKLESKSGSGCCQPDKDSLTEESVIESVKNYYGKTLATNKDLKTSACTLGGATMPAHVKQAIGLVHDEVVSKFYGCGLVVPDGLPGHKVLDLGCGAGMDCYVLSKLVGQNGFVTGVDMTDEQIGTARKYVDYHREKFGYKQANVEFVQGYIEKLGEAGIKENFYDIIVSNCVVNLSSNKEAVLREAFRSLKVGGELYFSDVYCSQVLSDDFRKNKVLWGECIAGALYWRQLIDLARNVGFATPRLVSAHILEDQGLRNSLINDPANENIVKELAEAKFISATYRLFKLPEVKETTPMEVTYKGTILHSEKQFVLDVNTSFTTWDTRVVDADVATILKSSRYSSYFNFASTASSPSDNTASLNPFEFAQQQNKSSSISGGCCGGTAASKSCCS